MTQPGTEQSRRTSASTLLRPTAKLLPEHTRRHNRSLVLQTLYRTGRLSRADIARETSLTRVTTSDLVAELIAEGLVVELGQRDDARPGKPATLLDVDRTAYSIVGLDLSEHDRFRGAVLDLDGQVLHRAEVARGSRTGEAAFSRALELARKLTEAATAPVLGVGVGSPGIVDETGTVLRAPNLGWSGLPLQARLADALQLPVLAANDANAAVLAEHSFGGSGGDVILVRIGHGVGAGLLVGGRLLQGSRSGAGEIGHVVVGTDGGPMCVCGTHGCLEAWLSTPRLEAALAEVPEDAGSRDAVLHAAGRRLGIALAPVVVTLDLPVVVLSGPPALLDGPLGDATASTLAERSRPDLTGGTTVRTTTLGRDIVLRGAAAMVISGQLGVS